MPAKPLSAGQLIFTLLYLLWWPALLVFLSGDWHWTEGWIWAIWFFTTTAGITGWLMVHDPALLQERFRKPNTGNAEPWDKFFFLLTGLTFLGWMIIMPLDSRRFQWSPEFPLSLKVAGMALLLISSWFLYRAFRDNTFLSPLVRVQTERQQHLITTGVYGFVRHPMYLGALCMVFGSPLLLQSLWGVALGAALTLLMAWRTLGEERMLRRAFPDYLSYQKKVKFRFLPGIW